MDSALLATFAISNQTITDHILKKNLDILKDGRKLWSKCSDNIDSDIHRRNDIQKVLNQITESIRGKNNKIRNCYPLRSAIKKCPGTQPFHGTDTQDSGEFLAYLFNLFQVDIATTIRKTYGSNDSGKHPKWTLEGTLEDKHSSPIVDVVSTTLNEVKTDYDITKFVKQKLYATFTPDNIWKPSPDKTYSRRKEVFELTKSPIIIFNLVRTYGKPKFKKGKFSGIKTINIWKKISAPETMMLDDKQLELTSIVVHTGGAHYIANFKCEGAWYWYDDNPGGSKHIIKHTGSYENMLETKPSPLTHGTLFFYT